MGVPEHEIEGRFEDGEELTADEVATLELADSDGEPMTSEAFTRSIEEALEDLRVNGPVPGAEVARMLEDAFVEFESRRDAPHNAERASA